MLFRAELIELPSCHLLPLPVCNLQNSGRSTRARPTSQNIRSVTRLQNCYSHDTFFPTSSMYSNIDFHINKEYLLENLACVLCLIRPSNVSQQPHKLPEAEALQSRDPAWEGRGYLALCSTCLQNKHQWVAVIILAGITLDPEYSPLLPPPVSRLSQGCGAGGLQTTGRTLPRSSQHLLTLPLQIGSS